MSTKSAFISIVGPTNAGKSTLLNRIMGKKVSIVTHKVQTTRCIIRAILTQDETQLVFLDTPGIFLPKFDMERRLVKSAWNSVRDIDLVLIIIDGSHGVTPNVEKILQKLEENAIIVINKTDTLRQEQLLKLIAKISDIYTKFKKIIPISALKNHGVEELKQYLISESVESPWYFDKKESTDAPINFTLSEITREKLFLRVHQEIPYSSMVETELAEDKNGIFIVHQAIYVLSESQKKIVIGKGGIAIKRIRENAMREMSEILKKRVNLFIFVKIRPKWQEDKELVRHFSYL